mgnify:CR=1 FL=1
MSERSNERITDELLICDSEEAYVKRLAEFLLLKKEVAVGVRTPTATSFFKSMKESVCLRERGLF